MGCRTISMGFRFEDGVGADYTVQIMGWWGGQLDAPALGGDEITGMCAVVAVGEHLARPAEVYTFFIGRQGQDRRLSHQPVQCGDSETVLRFLLCTRLLALKPKSFVIWKIIHAVP